MPPKSLSKTSILDRYADGERDFRGADLRGLSLVDVDLEEVDLSGADLRGTNFRNTRLARANFREARCGARWLVQIGRWLAAITLGLLSGLLLSLPGEFLRILFTPAAEIRHNWASFGIMSWVVIVSINASLLKNGSLAIAAAITIFGATTIAVLGVFGFAFGFINTTAAAFPAAGIVAIASSIIIAGTIAGTIAGAAIRFTALAVAIIVAIFVNFAVHLNYLGHPDRLVKAGGSLSIMAFHTLLQLASLIGVWLRTRDGNPGHEWLRHLGVAFSSFGGTSFASTDLEGCCFSGARLRGTEFRDARLLRTDFTNACDLNWACFDPGDLRRLKVQQLLMTGNGADQILNHLRLRGIYLRNARLRAAKLGDADLSEALLSGADLRKANLIRTDLRGAALDGANLEGAKLSQASIDSLTYVRSQWTPDVLAKLHEDGVKIIALDAFPQGAQDRLVGDREGLTLEFSTLLSDFDRALVKLVIIYVLGRDTNCHVAECREQAGTAIVRLVGACRIDLEKVAEALYREVWEQTTQQQTALVRLADMMQSTTLRAGLTNLCHRLVQMTLRELVSVPVFNKAPPHSTLVRVAKMEQSQQRWVWNTKDDAIDSNRGCRLVLVHSEDHKDRALVKELSDHLSLLHRQRLLMTFGSLDVVPGQNFEDTLALHIDSADIVLVLLSASLLANEAAMTRAEHAQKLSIEPNSTFVVVPVMLRPCNWEDSSLSDIKPLPEEGLAVTQWQDRDAAWTSVVSSLRRHILNRA